MWGGGEEEGGGGDRGRGRGVTGGDGNGRGGERREDYLQYSTSKTKAGSQYDPNIRFRFSRT